MEKAEKSKKTGLKKGTEVADPQKAKLNALQQALGKIEKNFGRGAIMKLGDESVENVEVIPTGSIGLNYALG
ncbi:MAG: DNA recombination/repair protein RecA, partial [Muribaculaceae bacterium]|nr:DNA recombination/repair protein RecA [Muribaculaceae bacterium]